MRGTVNPDQLLFIPEIERFARQNRKQTRERVRTHRTLEMADPNGHQGEVPPPRTMGELVMAPVDGCDPGVRRPAIPANNFEIKPAMIHLVKQNPFRGERGENPYNHIAMFSQICNTLKINGASEESIKLIVFPFSLADHALSWFQSLRPNSITTWEDLVQKFINKYHPPGLRNKLLQEIFGFQQSPGESLHDSWERFQDILRRCPGHALETWRQVQIFYNGCYMETKAMIDAAAGGTINSKTEDEAYSLLELMASNNYQSSGDRVFSKKGIMEVGTLDAILAQNQLLAQQVTNMSNKLDGL